MLRSTLYSSWSRKVASRNRFKRGLSWEAWIGALNRRNVIRKVYGFFKARSYERQAQQLHEAYQEILNDPMNGCPGDFAEDRDRRIEQIYRKIDYWT